MPSAAIARRDCARAASSYSCAPRSTRAIAARYRIDSGCRSRARISRHARVASLPKWKNASASRAAGRARGPRELREEVVDLGVRRVRAREERAKRRAIASSRTSRQTSTPTTELSEHEASSRNALGARRGTFPPSTSSVSAASAAGGGASAVAAIAKDDDRRGRECRARRDDDGEIRP